MTLVALAADNELYHELYLKGGNALALVYGSTDRASLDLDFSLENDFDDPDSKRLQIAKALSKEFSSVGYRVFDVTMKQKPSDSRKGPIEGWGGYDVAFKLIEEDKALKIGDDIGAMQRQAIPVNPNKSPKMEIEISRCEYTQLTTVATLDDVEIQVYRPEAIIYEKLRAICQQMPRYPHRADKSQVPRARDFYDIHSTLKEHSDLNLLTPENLKHAKGIFEAKNVDPALLLDIEEFYEFHVLDWDSVTQTVRSGSLQDFRVYFDTVKELAIDLHAHWNV
ncbi:MAG TPA: nucleotidyl transferase AbiEii/AbiGii toxin family protein [Bellilinea sp.]|nr:nucleotidyl transferase AbiEii/AbiGii toxin family protein [Bellilinea sp.]